MDDRAIQWLVDRAQVTDVVTAFAVALDTRNWQLLRDCLADEVEVNYPDSVGVATFTGDGLVSTAQKFFPRLDATLHISANHQIVVNGDEATCVSTLLAAHFLASAGADAVQRQVGYYTNQLRRLDRWRIIRTEQRQAWTEGNPEVFTYAAAAFA